ncbi:MAG: WG repeat-containing protein [Cyanobacteriota bacterium]|nr:WG repeat-containing protein [Cyanobacteriota bacterium]
MKRINKTIFLFGFIFLMAISYSLHQATLVKTHYIEPQPSTLEQTLNLYPFTGENELQGYIDSTGKVIIEPQFSGAFDFSEGLAAVFIDVFRNDKYRYKYGYIDSTGKVVIPPQFKVAFPFSNRRAAVEIEGKMGYIDKAGKVVISRWAKINA